MTPPRSKTANNRKVVVRSSKISTPMSALGQSRLGHVGVMSALPPKADIETKSDMSAKCQKRTLRSQRLLTALCRFKIGLEGLDRDVDCRICVWTPQFVTGEHYGVQPLRIVTLIDGCRVRIHVTALTPFYDAQLSPRVARQACVGLRMDVSSAHAVPWFEECRYLLLAEE